MAQPYNIDLERITIKEYRSLFDKGQADDTGDAIVAKAAAITIEELQALSQPAYRRLIKAFFKAAQEPLADENLASGSSLL
jgi:hypothetical protein